MKTRLRWQSRPEHPVAAESQGTHQGPNYKNRSQISYKKLSGPTTMYPSCLRQIASYDIDQGQNCQHCLHICSQTRQKCIPYHNIALVRKGITRMLANVSNDDLTNLLGTVLEVDSRTYRPLCLYNNMGAHYGLTRRIDLIGDIENTFRSKLLRPFYDI